MRIRYHFSSRHDPMECEANAGLDRVPRLLEMARRLGVRVEEIDTADWPEERLREAYLQAVTPAIRRHSRAYSVREAFGTRRRGGQHYGRKVPALLVLADGSEAVEDVYPHREGDRFVTIREFLDRLLEDPGRYLERSGGGLNPRALARLRRAREEIFGGRSLPDDSTKILRRARETG